MLNRTFRKKRENEMDFSLQITSLADVLIIVLVFLLNTFSFDLRGAAEVTVPKSIKLPDATLSGGSDTGITVEISEHEVRIGDERAAPLKNYRFNGADLRGDLPRSSSSSILLDAFGREKRRRESVEPPVLIIADRRAPYATIQTVVASAALNGFTNIKFAVVAKK